MKIGMETGVLLSRKGYNAVNFLHGSVVPLKSLQLMKKAEPCIHYRQLIKISSEKLRRKIFSTILMHGFCQEIYLF